MEQHSLEVANGRGTAQVAVGAQPDKLSGTGAKRVVGHDHDDRGFSRRDDAPEALQPLLQGPLFRGLWFDVEIQNRDYEFIGIESASDSGLVQRRENLKLLAQGRGKKRLQVAIFRIEADSNRQLSSLGLRLR